MPAGKILITGASGFIGSNLVPYFQERGYEVLNLSELPPRDSKQQSVYKHCDVNDRDQVLSLFKAFKPRYVIHMAARTDLDGKTLEDYKSNIGGVQNVIDAVNSVGTVERALYASSRLVFEIGHTPKHLYDYKPTTPYGESKVETERIVRAQSADAVPWTLFRPTSIWGEWFDIPYKGFFLSVAANRYMHPKGLRIPKSYGYVGNTCYELDCYLNAPVEKVNGQVFFTLDYPAIDILGFGTAIQKAVGSKPIRQVPMSFLRGLATTGDILKAAGMRNPPLTSFRLNNLITPMEYEHQREEAICGKLPFTMEEGVERTVRWLRDTGQV